MKKTQASPGTGSRQAGPGPEVRDLRCQGAVSPRTVDSGRPLLRWRLWSPEGARQVAYQVRVATQPDALAVEGGETWDSGRVESDRSIGVPYDGPPLCPCSDYVWTVRCWTAGQAPSDWAAPAHFRTGLLSGGVWGAPWISAPEDLRLSQGAARAFYFARTIDLSRDIASAYLYATAMGVYQVVVNGAVADLGEQAPGWTSYRHTLHYQATDIGPLLRTGRNQLVVVLADGWWAGNIAWWGRNIYGDHTAVSLELRLTYADGGTDLVRTGPDWRVGTGRLVESDLIMGETIDLRLPGPHDDCLALLPGRSRAVAIEPAPLAAVVAQPHPAVRAQDVLPPALVLRRSAKRTVIDFGRHITGRVRLGLHGKRGTVVVVRHAEALEPDGSLYRANLRTARQEDRFVLSGGQDVLVPTFALHGFRYVEVIGYRGTIAPEDVRAEVVHSQLEVTGSFWTSNPVVNELQEAIVWAQRGNFVHIPVDCAQRDERLGWTGDINLFAPTALFNMDCTAFLESWLTSLAQGQLESGSVPDIAPYTDEPLPPRDINVGQPGWADAIVGVPWELYLHSGDRGILERLWGPMTRWVDHLSARGEGLVRGGGVFGDWNALGQPTPTELIGTYWFARTASTMAKIAAALGRDTDRTTYEHLHGAVRKAFNERFVATDGEVAGATQTAYVLALDLGIEDDGARSGAGRNLVRAVADAGWHPTTGFVGTSRLLPVLCESGYPDVAYRLLAATSYPSWGFMLANGGTTLWEHWGSWTPRRGFQDPRMNSLNHFAFGSVGEWLYRYVAGINPDPGNPGYQGVVIRPFPDTFLRETRAHLDTPTGRVVSSWWTDGRKVRLSLVVPDNCRATVQLPWLPMGTEISAAEPEGATEPIRLGGTLSFEVSPGTRTFMLPHPARDSQRECPNGEAERSTPSPRVTA